MEAESRQVRRRQERQEGRPAPLPGMRRMGAVEYLRHLQLTREWQAVQALEGVIIDMATPEQRAAREAAMAEEWARIREAEEA